MSAIDTIHLIHHTHHDLGYTDPPATCWRLFRRYHEQVLELIEQTADLPEAARFRWTCEVFEPTRAFLEASSSQQRRRFTRAVEEGRIEVGGLPWTGSALMSEATLADRFAAWRGSTGEMPLGTALQVDVTGLSWGLVPLLSQRAAPLIWLSSNPYSSGLTEARPRFVLWEGPDGETIPLYLARHYNDGAGWFHERMWRRGPLPRSHDPFFSPPEPDEFFATDRASLERAHARLQAKLGELTHWTWPLIAEPVTNEWRFDNDPPNPALPHFVAAWNAAGFTPRLELSTPARFLADFRRRVGLDELPRLRGDLCDWWMDGVMSASETVLQGRRATQRLWSLPGLAHAIDGDPASPQHGEAAARGRWEIGLIEEHTFDAYESVPRPGSSNTLAGLAETLRQGAAADEAAQEATNAVLQSSPRVGRFARDPVIAVANPNPDGEAAGWITVSAQAVRRPCSALRDLDSDLELPVERRAGPEMDQPPGRLPEGIDGSQVETPIQHEWGFCVTALRSLVPAVPAGTVRRFAPIDRFPDPAKIPRARDPLHWDWEPDTGRIADVRGETTSLVGAVGPEGARFGDPVVEDPAMEGARARLLTRSPRHNTELMPPEALVPSLVEHRLEPGYERIHRRFAHPALAGVDQQVTLCRWQPWIELETRLHLRARLAPLGVSLALPLAGDGEGMAYGSMGARTRVGHDQAAEAAGEFFCTDGGVFAKAPGAMCCTVDCRDTPIVAPDTIATRSGRKAFVPSSNRLYPVLHQSWWQTNFPPTRTVTICFVHRISWGEPEDENGPPTTNDPLICFPGVR